LPQNGEKKYSFYVFELGKGRFERLMMRNGKGAQRAPANICTAICLKVYLTGMGFSGNIVMPVFGLHKLHYEQNLCQVI